MNQEKGSKIDGASAIKRERGREHEDAWRETEEEEKVKERVREKEEEGTKDK